MLKHVPSLSEFPNSFTVEEDGATGQKRFWYVCPGCKWICAIALRPVVDGSPQSWEFNGSMEAPRPPSVDQPCQLLARLPHRRCIYLCIGPS